VVSVSVDFRPRLPGPFGAARQTRDGLYAHHAAIVAAGA
jgi:hypothetical protein